MKKGIFLLGLFISVTRLYALLPQPTEIWAIDQYPISIRSQHLPELDSIIARPAAAYPVYGIYGWNYEYVQGYRAGVQQMGWKVVRAGGDFSDLFMTTLVNDGVLVLKTLGGTKRDQFASDSAFIASHLAGVTTFLHRYGPGGTYFDDNPTQPVRPVEYVEIWNEPNYQYMIPDSDPMSLAFAQRETLYAKLLPASYAHIKANWPTVKVVAFSTGGGASTVGNGFIQHVHELNPDVANSYDIISIHPYVNPAPPEGYNTKAQKIAPSLADLREILGTYGRAETEIWFSEVGWPISKAEGGYYDVDGSTQREQAAYTARLYAWALRLGVPYVTNMFISDTDNFNGGFFNRDKTWRESAHAVKTMTGIMPFPKLVGAVNDGDRYWHAYKFIADINAAQPETVTMAWDVKGPREITLSTGTGGATVTDMLGTDSTVADGGTLTIGPNPVYVRNGGVAGIGGYLSGTGAAPAMHADDALYGLDGRRYQNGTTVPGVYVRMSAEGLKKTIIIK